MLTTEEYRALREKTPMIFTISKPKPKPAKSAWDEGFEFACEIISYDSLCLIDCPYPSDAVEHDQWWSGYNTAVSEGFVEDFRSVSEVEGWDDDGCI
jgi:hypothetical protein